MANPISLEDLSTALNTELNFSSDLSKTLASKSDLASGSKWTTVTGTPEKIYYNNGYVGIGTDNPLYKLHIEGDLGVTTIKGLDTDRPPKLQTGVIIDNADHIVNKTYVDNSLASAGSKWTTVTATPANIYYNGGNVGIGTNLPDHPLHVRGGTNYQYPGFFTAMYFYISNTSNFQTSGPNPYFYTSIYSEGGIVSGNLIASVSDRRIKTNIEELNDNEALLKFRNLKPCKYNYIDTFNRTSDKVYGFIAQEVKETMPYAVNILPSNEFIPNVYKFALHNNNVITFAENHNLDLDGNIKLILQNNKEITVPYTIIDELKININTSNLSDNEQPSNDLIQNENGNHLAHNIFVYGTEVDDFHTLNKDAIWTTAAAALQEVDKIQQADGIKIQTLENKVVNLETELQNEKNKVSNLESQLADVLSRLSALENN